MAVDPNKIGQIKSRTGAPTSAPAPAQEQETTEPVAAEQNPGQLRGLNEFRSQLGGAYPAMIQDMALRSSGSSVMGGIMANEQYIDATTVGGAFKAGPSILERFWMDDFRSGPIPRNRTFEIDPIRLYEYMPQTRPFALGLKALGLEDQLTFTTPGVAANVANNVWSSTLGAAAKRAGEVVNALAGGLEWSVDTAGYVWSRTPMYNSNIVKPSWETAHRIGAGDVWTLGTQTQTGNYSEYVAQAKRDYEAYQRNLENKGILEQTGIAMKNAWTGKTPDVWATEGIDTAMGGAPIFVPEGFDPNDPAQMQELLDGPQGDRIGLTSEAAQFVGEWYVGAAPFKAVKLARYGSEMLDVGGITSRNVALARINAKMEKETDEFIEFVESGGERGKMTSMGADAEALARGSHREILKFDWVKPKRAAGGTEAQVIAGVGAEITDPVTAAIFRAAMSGSGKYQQVLIEKHGLIADAIARQRNATVKMGTSEELLWIQTPSGTVINPILRNNLDGLPDQALVEDALRMAEELNVLDKAGFAVAEAGMQGVRTAGTNTVWGKRIANAWRAGASHRAENTIASKLRGGSTVTDENASWGDRVTRMGDDVSPIEEWSFQVSKHFRPVGILNWVNTEKQAGWIVVRGTDNTDAGLEWNAAFAGSKVLREDQQFQARMMQMWGRAYTEEEKLRAVGYIERAAVNRIAKKYNPNGDTADAIAVYNMIYGMRQHTLDTLKRQKGKDVGYGYDPETGKLLLSSPLLASQLESRVPILDFALFEKTMKRMYGRTYGSVFKATPEGAPRTIGGGGHVVNMFLDEVNALWKMNVLLRAGYTQRNLTEGWMRTLAYLGTIPGAAPEKIATGTGRLFMNPWRAGQRYKIGEQQKAVSEIMDGTRTMVKTLDDDIAQLEAKIAARPTGVRERDLRMQLASAKAERAQYQADLEFQQSYMKMLADKRYKNRHRRMFDEEDAAFGGIHGDLRRITSGADVNVDTFLQGRAARQLIASIEDAKYTIVDPGDANYFEELVTAGEQFTGDKLAMMAVRNSSVDEMSTWLMTPPGRKYLRNLGIRRDEASARNHAARVHRIVNNYLPTQESKDLFTKSITPTSEEVAASLGSARLSPIHGHEIQQAAPFSAKRSYAKATEARGEIFKWIGSKPESYLVRHPFYAEVYARRRSEMYGLARAQGREISDDLVESIERSAHRSAQKATTDVLFTINRYSNPAALMKFLSPFFSAWENSMRTWGTLIARDPSTLMRGSFLWNTINEYGSVYTYDGKRVPEDKWGFLTGDYQEGLVMLPEAWTRGLAEKTGGYLPAFPKGGFNVVTPGEAPYLPGFGPGVLAPVQLVLANKPDVQNFLRRAMGDKLYRQFAPFGRIQEFSFSQLLSSGQKKAVVQAAGDSNEDYLKVSSGVAKNMLTDWYRSGADPSTMPTENDFVNATNNWYQFSALANYALPVAATRVSKYQAELSAWRAMSQVMPFDEALARFEEMYPGAVALTISGTERSVTGIRSDENAFAVVDRNTALIKKYGDRVGQDSFSPAGILAAASMKGAFNPAVYDYFAKATDPYSGDRYSQPLRVGEFEDEVRNRTAWLEINQIKADMAQAVEDGAISKSEAQDIVKQYALNTEPGGMVDRFGAGWKKTYQSFASRQATSLITIYQLASDKQFAESMDGSTRTWDLIREYFDVREGMMADLVAAEGDDDTRRDIRAAFSEWALNHRNSSLSFSDFYDMFLESDDLTVDISLPDGGQ